MRAEALQCAWVGAVDAGNRVGERGPVVGIRQLDRLAGGPAVDKELARQAVWIAIVPKGLRRQTGGGELFVSAELASAAGLAGVGEHLDDRVVSVAGTNAPEQVVAPLPVVDNRHFPVAEAAGGGIGEIA